MNQEFKLINMSPAIEIYDRNKSIYQNYFNLLLRENKKVNLVSRETSKADLEKLTIESLVPISILEDSFEKYLDIGSGGGFPSVPIIVSNIINKEAMLLERIQKKCSALTRILYQLKPATQFSVIPQSLESFSTEQKFDLITLRYVKLTSQLLDLIYSFLTPDGLFIYYSQPDFSISGNYSSFEIFTFKLGNVDKSFTLFKKTVF